jgi:hypothetical protein
MQPEPKQPNHPEPHVDELPDIFDNEEEYIGVNGEHIYISIAPAQPSMNAIINSSVDPHEIRVHDPKNPRIEKGALFPDITTFGKAVRHYAVKISFVCSWHQDRPYQVQSNT